jgi:hypothetical protein
MMYWVNMTHVKGSVNKRQMLILEVSKLEEVWPVARLTARHFSSRQSRFDHHRLLRTRGLLRKLFIYVLRSLGASVLLISRNSVTKSGPGLCYTRTQLMVNTNSVSLCTRTFKRVR